MNHLSYLCVVSMWRFGQHAIFEDLEGPGGTQIEENESTFGVVVIHDSKSAWLYHKTQLDMKEDEAANSATKGWRIVKHMPRATYKIKIGDTIKFGRVRFRIVRMHGRNDFLASEPQISDAPSHESSI